MIGRSDTTPDRYTFGELIGAGASSHVYEGTDNRTGSTVAIKLLNPHLHTDRVSLERFRREIQITRHIGHPQILRIHDFVTEPDRVFLVMDRLAGRELKQVIALDHPLDEERALDLLGQILRVLAVCHARDVVHRDLKPQNVFVDAKDRVTLIDFGISRMTALHDLTQTGTSLGSPEYMAPELFATSAWDPRTDLYALGVIAFELLGGTLPFKGETLAMLFREHREAPVPSLADRRETLAPWLQDWVERLLAKRAVDRYQSADEALLDLERRNVAARSLPALPKRRCVQCDEETPETLSICIACGAEVLGFLKPGRHDVHSARDASGEELERFLARLLGRAIPPRKKGASLLFERIDALAAEHLKRRAASEGVYLEVRRSSLLPSRVAVPLLVLAHLLVFDLILPMGLSIVHGATTTFLYESNFSWRMVAWGLSSFSFYIAALASLLAGPILSRRVARSQRPLLRNPGAELSGSIRDPEWLAGLLPTLSSEHGGRRLVAEMVEKLLLLETACEEDATTDIAKLRGLIESAARLEDLRDEITSQLDDRELFRLTEQSAALAARSSLHGPHTQQEAIDSEQADVDESLRAYAALEERAASLGNRLVAVNAAFNQWIAARLVFHEPVDAIALESLRDGLDRAEVEATALRSVSALSGVALMEPGA